MIRTHAVTEIPLQLYSFHLAQHAAPAGRTLSRKVSLNPALAGEAISRVPVMVLRDAYGHHEPGAPAGGGGGPPRGGYTKACVLPPTSPTPPTSPAHSPAPRRYAGSAHGATELTWLAVGPHARSMPTRLIRSGAEPREPLPSDVLGHPWQRQSQLLAASAAAAAGPAGRRR
jgi:hypothetical protein